MENPTQTAELVDDNQPIVASNPNLDDYEAQSFLLPVPHDDDSLLDDGDVSLNSPDSEFELLEPHDDDLGDAPDELDDWDEELDDESDDLDGFSQHLDTENGNLEAVNRDLEPENGNLAAISPQLAVDAPQLADNFIKLVKPSNNLVSDVKMSVILKAIEAMPKATKKGSPPVGVRAEIYEEIKAICEEGGISVVDYVSSIMMHHKEFFDFQTTQTDLSKANKRVIDLMLELAGLHKELLKVNSAHDLLGSIVDNKDSETERLNAIIAHGEGQITMLTQQVNSLKDTILSVSNDVEEQVGGFYKEVFPEGHKRAMADLYQEKIYPATVAWGAIKLPTEDYFNDFYFTRVKYHYDQIIKEIEIRANLQAQKQRNNDV